MNDRAYKISVLVASLFVALSLLAEAEQNPISKPDDLVARHLESMGNAQARKGVKTRMAHGTAQFKLLSGGAGSLDGTSAFVSEGNRFHFMLKFNSADYHGEHFIFDGDRVQVVTATGQQNRSPLGGLVYVQDAMLRDGLWGGELSTAWALSNLEERKPKLIYEGLKNIDGQQLHDLRYQPRKRTDMDIHLYFDPETYRLVRTVYSLSIRPGMANVPPPPPDGVAPGIFTSSMDNGIRTNPESKEVQTARQQQTRYRIEERFSEFKGADGLTLPTHYNIHFSQELQDGRTTVSEWDIREEEVKNNISLDPRNFVVK
jgi:hypothetical protein